MTRHHEKAFMSNSVLSTRDLKIRHSRSHAKKQSSSLNNTGGDSTGGNGQQRHRRQSEMSIVDNIVIKN